MQVIPYPYNFDSFIITTQIYGVWVFASESFPIMISFINIILKFYIKHVKKKSTNEIYLESRELCVSHPGTRLTVLGVYNTRCNRVRLGTHVHGVFVTTVSFADEAAKLMDCTHFDDCFFYFADETDRALRKLHITIIILVFGD